MKIINFILFYFVVFASVEACADVMEDARKQGLDFGTSYKNSAASTVTTQNKSSVPGYTTDNPEQIKYYNGANTENDAQAKIKTSQEGDLMTKGLPNRPHVQVSLNDSFLNKSKAIEKNPDEVIRMLTGTYGECKPLTYTSTDSEVRTCDEYEDRTGGACVVGQEVTVDAKHSYQCSKERKFTDKTCDKNLNLTCASWGICGGDAGAVTVSGEETTYNYPYINVGVGWRGGGGCAQHVRDTNIYIKDLSLIDSARFVSIGWDDVIRIVINGVSIYQNGSFTRKCERGTVFNASPNIDLKPYLIQGNNHVVLTVGIAGMGFAAARYSIYQKCCNNWQENWGEVCQN